jgi:hypothetical protein
MTSALIIFLLSALLGANAFCGVRVTKVTNQAFKWKLQSVESPWKVDEDTAGLDCQSSTDIKRAEDLARKLAQEEARRAFELKRKVDEELHQKLLLELRAKQDEAQRQPKTEKVSAAPQVNNEVARITPAPVSEPIGASTKISAGTSGFDIGLLIAFPIIVGTLGFFFLFPILGPQLADKLPPVPPM